MARPRCDKHLVPESLCVCVCCVRIPCHSLAHALSESSLVGVVGVVQWACPSGENFFCLEAPRNDLRIYLLHVMIQDHVHK